MALVAQVVPPRAASESAAAKRSPAKHWPGLGGSRAAGGTAPWHLSPRDRVRPLARPRAGTCAPASHTNAEAASALVDVGADRPGNAWRSRGKRVTRVAAFFPLHVWTCDARGSGPRGCSVRRRWWHVRSWFVKRTTCVGQ
jgi:hypothetical protein